MIVQGELSSNGLKDALRAGRRQVGFWLTLASPNVTEIAAGAGFDWVLIDMEHAPNEPNMIIEHLRAAACGGPAEAVVRVPWNEPVMVKRLLDFGVRSFMFPFVQTEAEARAAVAATRYPPDGIRGFSGVSRATHFGRIPDYVARCSDEICILVQIETPQALGQVQEIAAVDGVDGVFIGPNDLAANMGLVGKANDPRVLAEIEEGRGRIASAGKPAGVMNFNEEGARLQFEAGFSFIAVGGDSGLLARGAEKLARTFK